jgi:hypothetical protein
MQAQAAKRIGSSRLLKAALILAILVGVALSALALATVIDRSDTTTPAEGRVVPNPAVAAQQPDIQEDASAYVLPEEAVDAPLRLDRLKAHSSVGQGEGLLDGQRQHDVGVERAIDAQRMQFLELNLYLPGDADSTLEIQRLQQLYWELEAPRTPASSTATYDDRNGTSGQWTEGLAER